MSDYEKLCERIVLAETKDEVKEIMSELWSSSVTEMEYSELFEELCRKWGKVNA